MGFAKGSREDIPEGALAQPTLPALIFSSSGAAAGPADREEQMWFGTGVRAEEPPAVYLEESSAKSDSRGEG